MTPYYIGADNLAHVTYDVVALTDEINEINATQIHMASYHIRDGDGHLLYICSLLYTVNKSTLAMRFALPNNTNMSSNI